MIKLFLKFLLTFFIISNCFGNEIITLSGGNHDNISQAINELSEIGTIEIKGNIYIGKNIVIPEGITLHFYNGNKIVLDKASTLDMYGNIDSELFQIFETSIKHKLTIYNETIYPEWFGLCSYQSHKNSYDDSIPIQKSINATTVGGLIHMKGRFYSVENTISISDSEAGIKIFGSGAYYSSDSQTNYIQALNTNTIFHIKAFGVRVEDLNFVGPISTHKGVDAKGTAIKYIRDSGKKDLDASVINCMFRDFRTAIFARGANLKIVDNTFTYCYTGIYIDKVSNKNYTDDIDFINAHEANTRGFIIDRNRFHSIGGSLYDPSLEGATCIKISQDEGYSEFSGIPGLNWTVYGYYNHITNNYADDCMTFFEGSVDRSKVDGNSILKSGRTAIKAFAGAYGSISNNLIDGSRNWNAHNLFPYHPNDKKVLGYPDGHGIHVKNANFLSIQNNLIINKRYHGIFLERSRNTSIQSNTIVNFNYHRFFKRAGKSIEINDPIIWDGIHVANTRDNHNIQNIIANNHISIPFSLDGYYPKSKKKKEYGLHGRYGIYVGDGDARGFVTNNFVVKDRLKKQVLIDK